MTKRDSKTIIFIVLLVSFMVSTLVFIESAITNNMFLLTISVVMYIVTYLSYLITNTYAKK